MKLLLNLSLVLVSSYILSATATVATEHAEAEAAAEAVPAERQLQVCPGGGHFGVGAAIGAGACTSVGSCFCATATVGAAGCLGDDACDSADGIIGANACIGINACQNTQATASIGAAACLGDDACHGAFALIGVGSCLGLTACQNANGMIAAGACNGPDSCKELGPMATIGTGSCIGDGTNCKGLNSLVGALSCLGEGACEGTTGDVAAGSCVGEGSCVGATGAIAAGSCTKPGSCLRSKGVIGAGSCTAPGSCIGTKADFVAGAGSCTGPGSCRDATGTIAAGMCIGLDTCNGPSDAPTGSPTAAPTGSKAGGDPHFKTWNNTKFDYHGECDLVLIDNPSFADGLGMRLHIRTKRIQYYSFIETIALQIGEDYMEFTNDLDNYLINGEKAAGTDNTISDFKIMRTHSAITVMLDKKERGNSKAHIDFLYRKNGFPYVRPDGKATKFLEGSLGLLGEWGTGKMIARDGMTEIFDATEFALEWQVRDTEPMLFSTARSPQFPAVCTPPKQMLGGRLGDSHMKAAAEKACAAWAEDDKADCIFDVMATRSMHSAEPVAASIHSGGTVAMSY